MPIHLSSGNILTAFDYSLVESDPLIKESNLKFIESTPTENETANSLYIGQREYGTVKFDDPYVDFIVSDAATTCHIVLLVDKLTNNSSLCHFDGSDMSNGADAMINSLKKLNDSSQIEFNLYIIGGFNDPKKYSIKTTLSLMEIFMQSTEKFNLKLCLVTKLNNLVKNNINFPIAYGLGYNIKKSQVYMCNDFKEKGPDQGVRGARHFSESENLCIYDPIKYRLVIGPFNYESMEHADHYIRLPKNTLLKYFSTSPEQEPPEFVDNLKRTFQTMINYPDPLTSYFNHKPNVYKRHVDGQWIAEI